ncbi:Pal1 protein [Maudiozyma humilis]|uniref:Pal1 protein n=1 Tax=Maudiozyma humilis TaxID=51915 RepID=A0AAV5S6S7_MAUHU|nr:Pal1 protein [Kazachstania humilis]
MQYSIQTPSTTGSGRPFSTTNPFRMSGSNSAASPPAGTPISAATGSYGADPQFNDWARDQMGQQQQQRFQRNSTDSSLAFDSARSPPSKSSTNPFLADDDDADETDTDYNRNMGSSSHPSARDEKERLRQRYMEERDVNDTSPRRPGGEMPPSYDEVPRSRRTNGVYQEDKARHRSHRSNSNSGGSGSRSDRPRTHRHHSSGDRDREGDRERERRHHHGSSSAARREKRKSKMVPAKNVDTIDKLDVTGLFGGSFHHDGPFDACTPHRNKNNKAAPVMAFPADGPNSTIGGTFRKMSALDQIYGVDDADFDMYQHSSGRNASKDAIRTNVDDLRQVDAKSKAEKVHGPTTYGLGSTTFLDGAPAPAASSNTLGRGKSMSYRQTSFNSNTTSPGSPGIRRNMTVSSRPTNRYGSGSSDSMGFARPTAARSGSGPELTKTEVSFSTRERGAGDRSFGDDEDDVYLGSPGNSSGGVRFDSGAKKSSGRGNSFLKRVKSLKVGGRKR